MVDYLALVLVVAADHKAVLVAVDHTAGPVLGVDTAAAGHLRLRRNDCCRVAAVDSADCFVVAGCFHSSCSVHHGEVEDAAEEAAMRSAARRVVGEGDQLLLAEVALRADPQLRVEVATPHHRVAAVVVGVQQHPVTWHQAVSGPHRWLREAPFPPSFRPTRS